MFFCSSWICVCVCVVVIVIVIVAISLSLSNILRYYLLPNKIFFHNHKLGCALWGVFFHLFFYFALLCFGCLVLGVWFWVLGFGCLAFYVLLLACLLACAIYIYTYVHISILSYGAMALCEGKKLVASSCAGFLSLRDGVMEREGRGRWLCVFSIHLCLFSCPFPCPARFVGR